MRIKYIIHRIGYFSVIFFAFVLIGIVFVFTWTNYKYTVYHLPDCPNTYLTKIEYNRVFYRGFAFAYGNYKEGGIPEAECFLSSKMTGMDAILELWITCANEKITLRYPYGFYKPVGSKNTKIAIEPLYASQADSIRKSHKVLYILEE